MGEGALESDGEGVEVGEVRAVPLAVGCAVPDPLPLSVCEAVASPGGLGEELMLPDPHALAAAVRDCKGEPEDELDGGGEEVGGGEAGGEAEAREEPDKEGAPVSEALLRALGDTEAPCEELVLALAQGVGRPPVPQGEGEAERVAGSVGSAELTGDTEADPDTEPLTEPTAVPLLLMEAEALGAPEGEARGVPQAEPDDEWEDVWEAERALEEEAEGEGSGEALARAVGVGVAGALGAPLALEQGLPAGEALRVLDRLGEPVLEGERHREAEALREAARGGEGEPTLLALGALRLGTALLLPPPPPPAPLPLAVASPLVGSAEGVGEEGSVGRVEADTLPVSVAGGEEGGGVRVAEGSAVVLPPPPPPPVALGGGLGEAAALCGGVALAEALPPAGEAEALVEGHADAKGERVPLPVAQADVEAEGGREAVTDTEAKPLGKGDDVELRGDAEGEADVSGVEEFLPLAEGISEALAYPLALPVARSDRVLFPPEAEELAEAEGSSEGLRSAEGLRLAPMVAVALATERDPVALVCSDAVAFTVALALKEELLHALPERLPARLALAFTVRDAVAHRVRLPVPEEQKVGELEPLREAQLALDSALGVLWQLAPQEGAVVGVEAAVRVVEEVALVVGVRKERDAHWEAAVERVGALDRVTLVDTDRVGVERGVAVMFAE